MEEWAAEQGGEPDQARSDSPLRYRSPSPPPPEDPRFDPYDQTSPDNGYESMEHFLLRSEPPSLLELLPEPAREGSPRSIAHELDSGRKMDVIRCSNVPPYMPIEGVDAIK